MKLVSIFAPVALCAVATAQHPNDECATALAITGGITTADNSNASLNPADPAWTCGSNVVNDIWFVYTPSSDCTQTITTCNSVGNTLTDTVMEVFSGDCSIPNLIACNDDGCGGGFMSSLDINMLAGQDYYVRIGGWGGASGTFDLEIANGGFTLVGGLDPVGLAANNFTFTDGDTMEFNYAHCVPGSLAFITLNINEPVGVTVEIPGFVQSHAGTTPAGNLVIGPAQIVPGPNLQVAIPAGIFANGDVCRWQALYLDFVSVPLPVEASNPISTTYQAGSCIAGTEEGFEGLLAGLGGIYPAGWADGGGTWEWRTHSSGTPSGGTGPNGPSSGSIYMYCESSSPAILGDTYIMTTSSYSGGSAVKFDLSRVGATVGTLDVSVDDGSGAQSIGSFTGAGTTEWEIVNLALPAGLGANYTVTFTYTRDASFTGDIGIDEFCILQ